MNSYQHLGCPYIPCINTSHIQDVWKCPYVTNIFPQAEIVGNVNYPRAISKLVNISLWYIFIKLHTGPKDLFHLVLHITKTKPRSPESQQSELNYINIDKFFPSHHYFRFSSRENTTKIHLDQTSLSTLENNWHALYLLVSHNTNSQL